MVVCCCFFTVTGASLIDGSSLAPLQSLGGQSAQVWGGMHALLLGLQAMAPCPLNAARLSPTRALVTCGGGWSVQVEWTDWTFGFGNKIVGVLNT